MPQHELTERDHEIIATIRDMFARRPDTNLPQAGDAVEIHHPIKGKLYDTAHIERNWFGEPDTMTICTHASGRHVSTGNGVLWFDTSGGYWQSITAEQLTMFIRIGRIQKQFWTWGSRGVGAGRGIYFSVEVSHWRYTDERFY